LYSAAFSSLTLISPKEATHGHVRLKETLWQIDLILYFFYSGGERTGKLLGLSSAKYNPQALTWPTRT
jgi:hypothetical protein